MAGRVVVFGWAESIHIQRWVAGLAARGFEIRLISLGGMPLPQVETICLPRRGRFSYMWQASRAVRRAREFKPDLIHAHFAGGFGSWGTRCDFAPRLLSIWGTDVVELPQRMLARRTVIRNLHRADHLTATNAYLKQKAIALEPSVESRTTVVPFGVSLPEATTPEPETGPFRLLFAKVHHTRYAPDILLEAFARALDQFPEMILTMAGEGELTPQLRRQAADLGIADRVEFVGMIPQAEIHLRLAQSHLVVMPSLREAFGVVALEGGAQGRPVIATRVGGVPEIVRHEETGLLVAPGSVDELTAAILRLARDPELRRTLGARGRSLVETEYSWEGSLDRMAGLYERMMQNGPGGDAANSRR